MSLYDELKSRLGDAVKRADELTATIEKRGADAKASAEALPEGEERTQALRDAITAGQPTTDERAAFAAVMGDVRAYTERVEEQKTLEDARHAAAQASRGAVIRSEPLTYTHDKSIGENVSYFRDLWNMKQHGNTEAMDRLHRHAQEMDVELPARAARRSEHAEQEVRNAIGWDQPSPFEHRTNPNRTDGQGGYLVPPLWMMDELIPFLRAGRVVADQVRRFDLPEGTDSINIPKFLTGTAAAIQTADAAGVQSTDFTDTSVSAGVKTIAGQQDVAIQLVEQSPLSLDQILFEDLIADYNKKLDAQVIAGTNANGQVKGLYVTPGIGLWTGAASVTYTDAAPTAASIWGVFAKSVSQVSQLRFDTSSLKFFLHPRRWYWLVGGVDDSSRLLYVPSSFGPQNVMGLTSNTAQGYVGTVATGNPVFIDANMPTADTAGGGSGQDVSFALNTDDAFLFEGTLRQRTLPEVLSNTLQVRFQIYNYVAFLMRYGEALAIGSGSGFAAPSGY